MKFPILSVIFLTPLVGCFIIMLLKEKYDKSIKAIAIAVSAWVLGLSLCVAARFNPNTAKIQFEESFYWVKRFGISYHLGVDGLNLLLLVLTAILVFFAILVSFNITNRSKLFFSLVLLLETGLLGVFTSLDLILFYICWETVLIPTYLLITIWGGPNRQLAGIKFLIYTLLGSLVMLVGFLAIYFKAGINTFDMLELARVSFPLRFQRLAFLALFLGFAVKVPLVPFHSWQPDAYCESPTPITILLSGVLAKMGAYGFIGVAFRLLPDGTRSFATLVAVLALINIIYGNLVASAQRDLKRMFAYSSLAHMGFIILGAVVISLNAMKGAVVHIFNHGIIVGTLFLLIGLIYRRTGTREISELGGLQKEVPKLAGIFWFACLASFGMPVLSGFVGEFLVLLGTFQVKRAMAIIALLGAIIMAGYVFWMLLRINFGSLPKKVKSLTDLNYGELALLAPMAVLIVLLGVYPRLLISPISNSVAQLIRVLK